ncbi:putative F-box protein At4g10190 [Triticum dicoccoides]|uniref:putative F-box protein At4g10190 n=1 Tax=Triticum dicoccoides TaxID=85692 RepID=UPI000E7BC123|nr:putative F-box protein At4g10190 [Triticum dicoccoides]
MADGSRDISRRRNPADKLTEDLVVEILSHVPYKSLCRFKCVSKRWRGIISHPDHRKALPQHHLHDLAGFLYSSRGPGPDYLSIHNFNHVSPGGRPPIRPTLPFLPDCELFDLLDSCNGLLLCRRFETAYSRAFDYVVCNPATEKWVALPGFFSKMQAARLGFDPAVSSHFHVFQFVEDGAADANADTNDDDDGDSFGHVRAVDIYSSKTGAWTHKDSGWDFLPRIVSDSRSVFVNGFLHLLAIESAVVAMDVEGTTWRAIPMPDDEDAPIIDVDVGFIDLSRGRLYLANSDQHDFDKLSIWVLEDYGSEAWVLEHSVRYVNLFGVKNVRLGHEYHIVALHPQRNTIFLVYGHEKVLMSYEMDTGKVQFIHDLGQGSMEPYLPYVPLYSEALADWH